MKNVFIFILIFVLAGSAAAQKPKPADDRTELEAAVNAPLNSDKAALLEKFVTEHPKSKLLQSARESLVVARAAYAEELLRTGKSKESYDLFAKAVSEAPEPISEKLFDGAIAKFPSVLYWAGQRGPAFDLAALIETRSAGNAKQLQSLAMFYLSIEDGSRAKKLAESAIAADPAYSAAYETLGLANRMNFDLDAAENAYAKAVELDVSSISAKLSLAEMHRALGKPAEATALYREILEEKPDEAAASSGLVMSLFDEGKRDEAEAQLTAVTEKDDKNFVLLSSAAYWYAANGNGERSAELARKAVEIEPRYIWSHIALGRALMAQGDPVAAEKVLVAARRYANIPTLEYEIASARFKAGFFREAAEELTKSFEIESGKVRTLLGRRIERSSDSFTELVGYERRASIFEPMSSASQGDDEHIKALFAMTQSIDYGEPEAVVSTQIDKFIAGDDKMNLYRRLFAADVLLDKNIDIAKAAELTESVIGKTDAALEVTVPSAAVMASELYESRILAAARGEFLVIPNIPRSTLSSILRGRVELLSGRALFRQDKYDDATIRYKRAISVLPVDSAWWRTAWWRLGESLQASGSGREALDAYIKSYKNDKPSVVRYAVVEALYERVNGTKKGLEALIGENPLGVSDSETSKITPEPTPEATRTEPVIPTGVPVSKEPVKENTSTEIISIVETAQPSSTPAPEAETVQTIPDPVQTAEQSVEPTPTPTLAVTTEEVPNPIVQKEPEPETNSTAANTETKTVSPFDPVVIIVGKTEKAPEPKAAGQQNTALPETPANETLNGAAAAENLENKILTDSGEPTDDKAGTTRKRIVDGIKINEQIAEKCSIYASQETVSILNDGGSLGILIGIEGVDSKDITVTNSSPQDISIALQPDIGIKDRSFFVIRSRSTRTGVYNVIFSGGCGSKTIPVTVR